MENPSLNRWLSHLNVAFIEDFPACHVWLPEGNAKIDQNAVPCVLNYDPQQSLAFEGKIFTAPSAMPSLCLLGSCQTSQQLGSSHLGSNKNGCWIMAETSKKWRYDQQINRKNQKKSQVFIRYVNSSCLGSRNRTSPMVSSSEKTRGFSFRIFAAPARCPPGSVPQIIG
jgi:hypothetical protein